MILTCEELSLYPKKVISTYTKYKITQAQKSDFKRLFTSFLHPKKVIIRPKKVISKSQKSDFISQRSDSSSQKGDFNLKKSSISAPFRVTNTEQRTYIKNTEGKFVSFSTYPPLTVVRFAQCLRHCLNCIRFAHKFLSICW